MILVTGASGTVGSATVAALKAKGVDFKVGSRSPEKAKALGAPVVELDSTATGGPSRSSRRIWRPAGAERPRHTG
jgi:nucleoside-diphosphate-sugar epimerase